MTVFNEHLIEKRIQYRLVILLQITFKQSNYICKGLKSESQSVGRKTRRKKGTRILKDLNRKKDSPLLSRERLGFLFLHSGKVSDFKKHLTV